MQFLRLGDEKWYVKSTSEEQETKPTIPEIFAINLSPHENHQLWLPSRLNKKQVQQWIHTAMQFL